MDAFEPWCWRRLLRVPWTAWRSNQSILKEISPEYLLEGLMLKLKLQHLIRRTDALEKTLMLGKIEGRRRRGRLRIRWLDGITNSKDMSLQSSGSWWWTEKPGVLQSMGSQRVGHDWVTEELHPLLESFLDVSEDKESVCNAGDPGFIPELGRSPGEGNVYQLQYSCLENSMDRGAWWPIVHGIAESDTTEWLTFSLHFQQMKWACS